MKVAILGAGPAGLLAAHAVTMAGHEPIIISQKRKSVISGAQFLHIPIRGATESTEAFPITFDLVGYGSVYTKRLYRGMAVPVMSSWHNYEDGQVIFGFPMVETYDRLWDLYEPAINEMTVANGALSEIMTSFEFVVSTIPRWALDGKTGPDMKTYPHRKIWVAPWEPAKALGEDHVMYNGVADGQPLFRMSNIRGVASAEFTDPVPGGVEIVKPIAYQGPPSPDNLHTVGRYGRWSKMQLAHHAYTETLQLLRPDWDI